MKCNSPEPYRYTAPDMTKEDTIMDRSKLYTGVPVPDVPSTAAGDTWLEAWMAGVDAAQRTAGQDTGPTDTGQADEAPEISVLRAVMEERTRDAKRDIYALSARDRAILSFWLQEALSLVEDIEVSRRLVR